MFASCQEQTLSIFKKRNRRQTRKTLGEFNFGGQYQQNPGVLGGGLIKEKWLRLYEKNQLPKTFDQIIQSWE